MSCWCAATASVFPVWVSDEGEDEPVFDVRLTFGSTDVGLLGATDIWYASLLPTLLALTDDASAAEGAGGPPALLSPATNDR